MNEASLLYAAAGGLAGVAGERHFSQGQAAAAASAAVALAGAGVSGALGLSSGYAWPLTVDGMFAWGFCGALAGELA